MSDKIPVGISACLLSTKQQSAHSKLQAHVAKKRKTAKSDLAVFLCPWDSRSVGSLTSLSQRLIFAHNVYVIKPLRPE